MALGSAEGSRAEPRPPQVPQPPGPGRPGFGRQGARGAPVVAGGAGGPPVGGGGEVRQLRLQREPHGCDAGAGADKEASGQGGRSPLGGPWRPHPGRPSTGLLSSVTLLSAQPWRHPHWAPSLSARHRCPCTCPAPCVPCPVPANAGASHSPRQPTPDTAPPFTQCSRASHTHVWPGHISHVQTRVTCACAHTPAHTRVHMLRRGTGRAPVPPGHLHAR